MGENKKDIPIDEYIKKIKSQVYLLCIFILTIVLAIKIYTTDLNGLFKEFNFNDLLSLLLALFSITISIVFYLKANETSNQFYDNTYKFTQHTSEILGRIESGFGERLTNINESYHKLDDTVKRYYAKDTVQEKISEKEKNIKEEQNNKKEIIDTLFSNSKLDEEKQNELKKKLEESDSLLEEAREEIERLKNRIRRNERSDLHSTVERYYKSVLRRLDNLENASLRDINRALKDFIENNEIPIRFIRDMRYLNIIDIENNFTFYGRRLTRQLINELNNSL
ncbi:hypothetical protein NYR62_09320 [Actinobacillus genomosp. 1]|uniref:coiled-coil domain-containing protein n=1 Tax=Actinobacillus genomosp. 1 TaxID=254839 RepID=UPI0024425F73|nr:hypothetical protein [Actinobacillus genomosp. 1]WGE35786.1 hypothetical protein NYR62_09320 [Actinobacillus genomosp. 1]